MTLAQSDWRADPWDLSAPASYLLLSLPRRSGRSTFYLALLELAGRGAIVLQADSAAPGRAWIHPGPRAGAPIDDPALADLAATIADARSAAPDRSTVDLDELGRAVARRHGSLDGYARRVVLPGLIDRGLAAKTARRWLGLIPRTRYDLTPAGLDARDRLRSRLAIGNQQLPGWVDRDPATAAAFLTGAGSAVLLMTGPRPALARLQERHREWAATDAGAIAAVTLAGLPGLGDPAAPAIHSDSAADATFDSGLAFDIDAAIFDRFDNWIDPIGFDGGGAPGGFAGDHGAGGDIGGGDIGGGGDSGGNN